MIKKHLFVYLFAALAMGGVFTSCGDDDDDPIVNPEVKPEPKPEPEVVCPIVETTFTGKNGLTVSYSGQPMVGKTVKFTPDASNATKATLVLAGDEYSFMGGKPQAIAGVIPGEVTTTLNVDLKIEGDKVSFEGKDEKEGRVIEYKGEASKDAMSLNLDVTMPINDLTGKTFNLLAYKPTGKDKTAPITLKWDAESTLPVLGYPQKIQAILDLVTQIGFPVVKDQKPMNINQMISGVLQEISFLPDGNIQAKYKKDLTATEWQTSPLNVATYTVKDGKVMLYVNPMQIAFITKAVDFNQLLTSLMGVVSDAMVNGVPVAFEENNGVRSFYLDEQLLLPILQIINPALKDEDTINLIMGMIKKVISSQDGVDPNLAAQLEMIIKPIFVAFPDVIDSTKEMHFGINMVEAAK